MGNIVLALPLAPTAFCTLWEDEGRFYKGYLKRFGGRWLDTGDAGWIDENGYIHIMARSGKSPAPFLPPFVMHKTS
jgi:propionyl-CoA synthetase